MLVWMDNQRRQRPVMVARVPIHHLLTTLLTMYLRRAEELNPIQSDQQPSIQCLKLGQLAFSGQLLPQPMITRVKMAGRHPVQQVTNVIVARDSLHLENAFQVAPPSSLRHDALMS